MVLSKRRSRYLTPYALKRCIGATLILSLLASQQGFFVCEAVAQQVTAVQPPRMGFGGGSAGSLKAPSIGNVDLPVADLTPPAGFVPISEVLPQPGAAAPSAVVSVEPARLTAPAVVPGKMPARLEAASDRKPRGFAARVASAAKQFAQIPAGLAGLTFLRLKYDGGGKSSRGDAEPPGRGGNDSLDEPPVGSGGGGESAGGLLRRGEDENRRRIKQLRQALGDGPVGWDPFYFHVPSGPAEPALNVGLEAFLYKKMQHQHRWGQPHMLGQLEHYFTFVGGLLAAAGMEAERRELEAIRDAPAEPIQKDQRLNEYLMTLVGQLRAELKVRDESLQGRNEAIYMILARAYKKRAPGQTIFDVLDDAELDRIRAETQADTLWLLDIFEIGKINRWGEAGGSPYSIRGYHVKEEHGGDEALRAFVARAHRKGFKVMSDFIPNHYSLDSQLLQEHPEAFFHLVPPQPAAGEDLAHYTQKVMDAAPKDDRGYPLYHLIENHNYPEGGQRVHKFILVHYPFEWGYKWNDMAQIDYSHPVARAWQEEQIRRLFRSIEDGGFGLDGARRDMSYFEVNGRYAPHWTSVLAWEQGRATEGWVREELARARADFERRWASVKNEEILEVLVDAAREENPAARIIDEVYTHQPNVSRAGSNGLYNKKDLYEALVSRDPARINAALENVAFSEWQLGAAAWVNFPANHDVEEGNIIDKFGPYAEAVIANTLPLNPTLIYNGVELMAGREAMLIRDETPERARTRSEDDDKPLQKMIPFDAPAWINRAAGDPTRQKFFQAAAGAGRRNRDLFRDGVMEVLKLDQGSKDITAFIVAHADPKTGAQRALLVASNWSGGQAWTNFRIGDSGLAPLGAFLPKEDRDYILRDRANPSAEYRRSGRDLLENGLTIGLRGAHNHIFEISEVAADVAPAAELHTSALGQAFWAAVFAVLAGLLLASGVDASWIGAAKGAAAAVLAFFSLGYADMAARIFSAMRSLTKPIATPNWEHPALHSLSEPARKVVSAHEDFHRRRPSLGRLLGETGAYLSQIRHFPGYFWSTFRRSTLGEMLLGERAVRHLMDGYIRSRMVLVMALFVAAAVLAGGGSHLLGVWMNVVEKASLQGSAGHLSRLIYLTGAMPGLLLILGAVTAGFVFFSQATWYAHTRNGRKAIGERVLRQNQDFYGDDDRKAGLVNEWAENTKKLAVKMVAVRQALVYHPVFLLVSFGALFALGAVFGWMTLAVLLPVGVLIGVLSNRMWKVSEQKAAQEGELRARLHQTFENYPTVKAVGLEKEQIDANAKEMKTLAELETQEALLNTESSFLKTLAANFSLPFLTVFAAWILATSWIKGFGIGEMLQVGMFAGFITDSFANVISQYLDFKKADGGSRKASELASLPVAVKDREGAVELTAEGARGELEVRDVAFSYNEGQPLLKGVSIHLEPGRIGAIVGESGSGKSTLVSLLLDLYQPQSGSIRIDGRDMRGFTRESLGARVAYVPQTPWLQKGTLRDNLTYHLGRPVADGEVLSVLEQVNASEFVKGLQEGLDTEIKDEGKDLSGGLKQRIALARALLQKPSIILLDEPTSAMDNETERDVKASLRHLSAMNGSKPAILLITHRASLALEADKIFLLKGGIIEQQGSPSELLRQEGPFAGLFKGTSPQAPVAARRAPVEPAAAVSSDPEGPIPAAQEPARSEGGVRVWLRSIRDLFATLFLGEKGIRSYLWPFLTMRSLALALLLLEAGFSLGMAHMLGATVDEAKLIAKAGTGLVTGDLQWLSAGVLFLLATIPFLSRWRQRLYAFITKDVLFNVRKALLHKLHQWKVIEVDETGPGVIAGRLINDMRPWVKISVEIVPTLLLSALIAGGAAVMMLRMNPLLALTTIGMGFLIGRLTALIGSRGERLQAVYSEKDAGFGQFVLRILTNIRNIRMFRSEATEDRRLAEKADDVVASGRRVSAVWAAHAAVSVAGTELAKYALYIVGGWMLLNGFGVTMGTLITMAILADLFKKNVQQLSGSWMDLKLAQGQSRKPVEWLSKEDVPAGQVLADPASGAEGRGIEFRNVDFSYPATKGRSARQVLRGVSVKIQPGEMVAVVGPSHHGKSTLLGLILGWLSPNSPSGRVLIDGQDVARLDEKTLQKNIVVVFQSQKLFTNTLEYNLRVGAEDATEEELWEAIRAAGAEEFVRKKGLDSRGGLSGGEVQRVALAGAFLRMKRNGAKILLLDEPTASLDPATAAIVQASLRRHHATMLVVTHDIDGILDFPRALVVENGGIVQDGAPSALLDDTSGRFHELWEAGRKPKQHD